MKNNMFNINALIASKVVSEDYTSEKKTKDFLVSVEDCNDFFETIQGILRKLVNKEKADVLICFDDLPKCKTKIKRIRLLGEYNSENKKIKYYDQTPEFLEITKIQERFHALHHLTEDQNGEIWENFSKTPSFYLELLAQLFTYIYIRDINCSLLKDFKDLNDRQPLIYQTYKIVQHYDMDQAEKLYWEIRNKNYSDHVFKGLTEIENKLNNNMNNKTIENAVSSGIRTTINRFREHPFLYFTESDIHYSLKADILRGNSDLFYKFFKKEKKLQVSLVHLEYPTNFAFSRKDVHPDNVSEMKNKEQRGHFDLVVLNPDFVDKVSTQDYKLNLLKGIIAKSNSDYIELHQNYNTQHGDELLYVIEVKFTHLQTSNSIFDQIEIDNTKLSKALEKNQNIRPINLIFCYEEEKVNNFVNLVSNHKKIYKPNILNIIIEARINKEGDTITTKPLYVFDNGLNSIPNWVSKIVNGFIKI